MITKEQMMALSYNEGHTYVVGKTLLGEIIAVGIRETQHGSDVLVVLAGGDANPVLLGSLVKFQVPFELYDEPKQYVGELTNKRSTT